MTKSPQTNYFKRASDFEKIEKLLVITLTILSIVLTILKKDIPMFNAILVIIYLAIVFLKRMSDEAKYNGEKIRRMDFIDHSFKTKYIENSSEGYYDTDEIEYGFYKMVVNVFENSLFSSEISKKMYEKKQFKLLMISGMLVVLALVGIINMSYSLPIVQLILSGYFLLSYFDLKDYKERTEQIFLDFKKLFDSGLINNKESIEMHTPEIMRLCLMYETNISDKKIFLDSTIYNQVNGPLTQKWEEIKNKYSIK